MQFSVHPKSRPSLRLVAQLGAGLLVPLWVAPALAQGVGVAITPSPAMAPRDEREKLAPAVMAPAAAEAMRAEQTANQLAWRESLKRMSEAEADDPSRALAAYKRFFNERTMSPALGVEVGVKIAQLRLKLGDSKGALQTCEVLAAKYADEPTAALFYLQKARVLMEGKLLAEAAECVNEVMPELVALGPSRYREISDLLLKLVQANLDSGDAEGKERARVLCVGVEEIYLHWLKGGTLPHTWQMFEALKGKYREVGGEEQATELLPKVVDILLQAKATPQNPEGADISLMAARWCLDVGRNEDASKLYAKTSSYGNSFVTQVALTDQGFRLISEGNPQTALALMLSSSTEDLGPGPQWAVAQAYWAMEDWDKAEEALLKLNSPAFDSSSEDIRAVAASQLRLLRQFKKDPFVLTLERLEEHKNGSDLYYVLLHVKSLDAIPVKVVSSSPKSNVISSSLVRQKRADSGLIVSVYKVVYSREPLDNIKLQVFSSVKPNFQKETSVSCMNQI